MPRGWRTGAPFAALIALLALMLGGGTAALLARAPAPVPAAKINWVAHVEITPQGGYRMGNPAAPQKLIEYGSRTCPTCKQFDLDSRDAIARRVATGKFSYEFRDFPVHGGIDFAPIVLGRCVPPSRYFAMLHAMFDMQDDVWAKMNAIPQAQIDALGRDAPKISLFLGRKLGYVALAAKFGIPAAKAEACLSNPAALQAVLTRAQAAETKEGVHSTPTLILNGQRLSAVYWSGVEAVLALSDRPGG